jgi:hypothetical protein
LDKACEGLDESDSELLDDADENEIERPIARIKAVETAHRNMYWNHGCEVS